MIKVYLVYCQHYCDPAIEKVFFDENEANEYAQAKREKYESKSGWYVDFEEVQGKRDEEMKPIKTCELCEHEDREEWRCHIHLSDDSRMEYLKKDEFVIVTDYGALKFNSDNCPKCGRKMEG